jgi:hypothetical protein
MLIKILLLVLSSLLGEELRPLVSSANVPFLVDHAHGPFFEIRCSFFLFFYLLFSSNFYVSHLFFPMFLILPTILLLLAPSSSPAAAFNVAVCFVSFSLVPKTTNTMHRVPIIRSIGKPPNVNISDNFCEACCEERS